MNRKAFTLIEILAVIMILGILMTMATVSYASQLKKSRDKSFLIAENSFQDAVAEAYIDCKANYSDNDFCKNHKEPDSAGEVDRVYLYELINDEYLSKIKNPYNSPKECDAMSSYVIVESKTDVSDHNDLIYKVCLICGNHLSEGCN